MGTRKLVCNSSFSPHDCCSVGRCPHCNNVIDDYRSVKKCQYCGEPVAWDCKELSVDERAAATEEAKKHESEHNKKIKPCPFCGKSVPSPTIEISKSEKPYLYLSIGCIRCGIAITELSFKAELEPLQKANEELIKRWNTRWKDEPA